VIILRGILSFAITVVSLIGLTVIYVYAGRRVEVFSQVKAIGLSW